MSKALDHLKAALLIAFGLVALLFFVLNFQGLGYAVQTLLDRASARSINIFGVEVAFDEPHVDQALLSYDHVASADEKRVHDLIAGLTAEEFDRLMQIGEINENKLCKFEHPSDRMRNNAALDEEMEHKGLEKIDPSQKNLDAVRDQLAKDKAHGKSWDIGSPLSCYEMTLTGDGQNVKTVLVRNLSLGFEGGRKSSP
jgi:hypothetical protein